MGAAVPSISDRGWITAVPEKVDLLLSYFFESDSIQTYLYYGHVTNIQNILQKYGNNVPQLCVQLRSMLEPYFAGYFDSAVVEVNANNDPSVNPTNEVTLTIIATIADGGTEYSLGSLVQVNDSSFQRVMGIINYGVLPTNSGGIQS
jgi:hypothetical protein